MKTKNQTQNIKKENLLTDSELKEILGGLRLDGELCDGDVLNHNTVASCICNYNNSGLTTNKNDIAGCSCNCK